VRGGILDVFSTIAEHPVRVDFFGDEVETMRFFSVADQRSIGEDLPQLELPACRELLLSPQVRQRAREMQHEFPSLTQMLAKIAEGIPVDGMESLAPALVDRLVPITHYLPADAAIAVVAPERVSTRALSLVETNREFLSAAWNAAAAGAEAPIDLDAGDFLSLRQLRDAAGDRAWWTLSAFDSGAADDDDYIRIDATSVPSFTGQVDGAIDYVAGRLSEGWTVAVTAQGTGLVERAAEALGERGLAARSVDRFPVETEPGVAYLLQASVESGFESAELKLA